MSKVTDIHPSKQPRRPHFIKEWAEKRGLEQGELAKEIGADKGLVSRWYHGAAPGLEWQEKLAAYFDCEPDALFRHPDEDWLSRFFKGRTSEEVDRMKATMIAAFPRKQNRN